MFINSSGFATKSQLNQNVIPAVANGPHQEHAVTYLLTHRVLLLLQLPPRALGGTRSNAIQKHAVKPKKHWQLGGEAVQLQWKSVEIQLWAGWGTKCVSYSSLCELVCSNECFICYITKCCPKQKPLTAMSKCYSIWVIHKTKWKSEWMRALQLQTIHSCFSSRVPSLLGEHLHTPNALYFQA